MVPEKRKTSEVYILIKNKYNIYIYIYIYIYLYDHLLSFRPLFFLAHEGAVLVVPLVPPHLKASLSLRYVAPLPLVPVMRGLVTGWCRCYAERSDYQEATGRQPGGGTLRP